MEHLYDSAQHLNSLVIRQTPGKSININIKHTHKNRALIYLTQTTRLTSFIYCINYCCKLETEYKVPLKGTLLRDTIVEICSNLETLFDGWLVLAVGAAA